MKIKEALVRKDFEDAVTKAHDDALWEEIKKSVTAKYGPNARVSQLDPKERHMLSLLQRRGSPDALRPLNAKEERDLPSTFRPPSNIPDMSVKTDQTLLEKLAVALAKAGILGKKQGLR